ncbi:MAG: hypothetical protein AAFX99_37480, partial [Myxococcota bacterium]
SPYQVRARLDGYCEQTALVSVSLEQAARNDIALSERYIAGTVLDMTPRGNAGEPTNTALENIIGRPTGRWCRLDNHRSWSL